MSTEEEAITRDLAVLFAPGPSEQLGLRQATVTASAFGPPPTVTVTIGATSVPGVRYPDWYLPTVNDVVFVLFDGKAPMVLLVLAGASAVRTFPAGAILPYGASTAPAGWLNCTGAAVSRTTYAALFAAIGTTYGGGDGSTTFNLPNLSGRVPAGITGAGNFASMGQSGGAETHTLATGEMPSHAHNTTSVLYTTNTVHEHSGVGGFGSEGPFPNDGGAGAIATDTRGSGTAHNNLQPYLTLNFIIHT